MARAAIGDWDTTQRTCKFPVHHGVSFYFVSAIAEPKLKMKHIMWTMNKLFNDFVERARFGPRNMAVRLGDANIGWGKVNSELSDPSPKATALANNNHTVGGSHDDDSNLAMVNGTASSGSSSRILSAFTDNNTTPNYDLRVGIQFRPPRASYYIRQAQIRNASLKILLLAGQISNKQLSIWPGLATYSDVGDFTMKVYPAARNILSVIETTLAISFMADSLASHNPVTWYAEFDGVIEINGEVAGKLHIHQGDSRGFGFLRRCVGSAGELVDYNGGSKGTA